MAPSLILRREYDPAALLTRHPPQLDHPHKRLVFELAAPATRPHAGPVVLTRWRAAPLPAAVTLAATDVVAERGRFAYDGRDGVWHVNFADPHLFFGYGSALLAQDELQAAEHPLLGSLREALVAEGQPALTEDDREATPVLVAGVERCCEIETGPDAAAGRPAGLYGNRFAAAPADVVRRAVRVIDPATRSNLIAIAAPAGGHGRYTRAQLERVLVTAYTGFAAAVAESRALWPAAPVEIRTGFWGCGAFGGNRRVMTLLQVLAARLAGVDRLRFYAFDERGEVDFHAGVAELAGALDAGGPGEPLARLLDRVEALGHLWGTSDGN